MIEVIEPGDERNYVTVQAGGEPLLGLADDIVKTLYSEYGAVVFRGFEQKYQEFAQFTERFSDRFLTNASGGRAAIRGDPATQTVNLGTESFVLHSEMSHKPFRPEVCWFCCAVPPAAGGETVIADGVEIADALSAETRDSFASGGLRYKNRSTIDWLTSYFECDENAVAERLGDSPLQEYFTITEDGEVLQDYLAPGLVELRFCELPAFSNFLFFAREHRGTREFPTFADGTIIDDATYCEARSTADQVTRAVQWQKNDLLMLDNMRFMHGRNPVLDVKKRLIMTRFGQLTF